MSWGRPNDLFQSKEHHESLDKLVDKSIAEEVSEDEAIGDELDSFPLLTQQMMDEVSRKLETSPAMFNT